MHIWQIILLAYLVIGVTIAIAACAEAWREGDNRFVLTVAWAPVVALVWIFTLPLIIENERFLKASSAGQSRRILANRERRAGKYTRGRRS